MRKAITIFAIVLILGVLAAIGAFFFSREVLTEQEAQKIAMEQKAQAEQAKNPLRLVSPERALFFWLYNDSVVSLSDEGNLSITSNLIVTPVTGSPLFNTLRDVSVSQSGERALVISANSRGSLETYLYNASRNVWTRINGTVFAASISPDGKRVARIREAFGAPGGIEVISLEGEEGAIVSQAPLLDPRLSWITNTLLELTSVPSGVVPGFAFVVDTDLRKIFPVAFEKNGFLSLWSPSGEVAFAYWTEEGQERSAFIDREGVVLRYLDTPLLPKKCAFASNTQLVCGAPQKRSANEGTLMPDAYLMGAAQSEDQIVSVDVQTGRATTLLRPLEALDVFSPLVRDNVFYFINRYGGIYSFTL
jgi:hypothetical protein